MKPDTAQRIAQGIQLLKLDGYEDFTNSQLASVSGVSARTINRNRDLITILDFSLDKGRYHKCNIMKS